MILDDWSDEQILDYLRDITVPEEEETMLNIICDELEARLEGWCNPIIHFKGKEG